MISPRADLDERLDAVNRHDPGVDHPAGGHPQRQVKGLPELVDLVAKPRPDRPEADRIEKSSPVWVIDDEVEVELKDRSPVDRSGWPPVPRPRRSLPGDGPSEPSVA